MCEELLSVTMKVIVKLTKKIRSYTTKCKPFWAIIGAPIIQEFIFSYLPYQFLYLPTGRFWEIGIIRTILFASIHWYFGKWFVIYAFFGGFVIWWVMVEYGLLAAIVVHSLANVVDLSIGWRKRISNIGT